MFRVDTDLLLVSRWTFSVFTACSCVGEECFTEHLLIISARRWHEFDFSTPFLSLWIIDWMSTEVKLRHRDRNTKRVKKDAVYTDRYNPVCSCCPRSDHTSCTWQTNCDLFGVCPDNHNILLTKPLVEKFLCTFPSTDRFSQKCTLKRRDSVWANVDLFFFQDSASTRWSEPQGCSYSTKLSQDATIKRNAVSHIRG